MSGLLTKLNTLYSKYNLTDEQFFDAFSYVDWHHWDCMEETEADSFIEEIERVLRKRGTT